jgi:hypothetical protein
MARDTRAPPPGAPPPGESAAGQHRVAWPGAAASSDRGQAHSQHSRSRATCHDARPGDTTTGWLASEEAPGEPGWRARQPAVGDRRPLAAERRSGRGTRREVPFALPAGSPGRLRGPRRRGAHAMRHGPGRDRPEGHCHHPHRAGTLRRAMCEPTRLLPPAPHLASGGGSEREPGTQGTGWFINRSPKVDPERSYSLGLALRRPTGSTCHCRTALTATPAEIADGPPGQRTGLQFLGHEPWLWPNARLKTADGERPEARRPTRSACPGLTVGRSLWEPMLSLSVLFRDQSRSWPARAEPPD